MTSNLKQYTAEMEQKKTEQKAIISHTIPKEEYEQLITRYFASEKNTAFSLSICSECLQCENESLNCFSDWLNGE